MLILPSPARRAHLRAFSLAIGFTGGAALGCLLALRIGVWGIGPGLCLGLIGAAVGLRRPQSVCRAYMMWNRLSHLYIRAVRFAMKLICFRILTLLGRRGASPLNLVHPRAAGSLWEPRDQADHRSTSDGTRAGWCHGYVAWTRRSGKRWALSLLPFLVVLAATETETEIPMPSHSTYTIF
jgi:hypothetical protein